MLMPAAKAGCMTHKESKHTALQNQAATSHCCQVYTDPLTTLWKHEPGPQMLRAAVFSSASIRWEGSQQKQRRCTSRRPTAETPPPKSLGAALRVLRAPKLGLAVGPATPSLWASRCPN